MRLFHRHKYVCVHARMYHDVSYGEPGVEATHLNLRCSCSKLKTQILLGHWTMEMINGSN